MLSGISTPLSSTSTLSVPSSPKLDGLLNDSSKSTASTTAYSASTVIEQISSRASVSSTVYIYDLAEQAGFGSLTKSWSQSDETTAPVVSLQTRAGAGLSLVGRLSQGSSKDPLRGATLTAYNTPPGIAAMAQSLTYTPAPSSQGRLIIQVPNVTPVGETFTLSPTLASITPIVPILPDHFALLLSATPQEAVDLATLAYAVTDAHVIHVFDHHSFARELGNPLVVRQATQPPPTTLSDGLASAGYGFFDFVGDANAQTVIVVLNGPFAQALKSLVAGIPGVGILVVRVLRPWDENAIRTLIPATTKHVHVLDDVPTEFTQGNLYLDVFSSLLNPLQAGPIVKSHRITPSQTQAFLNVPSTLVTFLQELLPSPAPTSSVDLPQQKKLLFFSTPKSPLSHLARFVQQTFASRPSITSRLLTEYDVLSKPGGVTTDRLLLSTKPIGKHIASASFTLPITPNSTGECDFLAILDQSLLKSHSVIVHAKPGSVLLIATAWAAAELITNLPQEAIQAIREKSLHLCTLDTEGIASTLVGAAGPEQDIAQNVLALFAFLRLYLGKVATEQGVLKLALSSLGSTLDDTLLTKIGAHAWAGLSEIVVPEPDLSLDSDAAVQTPLKNFEFNAIAVETDDGETIVNGARLGSWHDAAKHIIFPSAFTPPLPVDTSEFPEIPALRPEVPERTFLVTCTVNRRFTPEEYDRNVFHLEFDTTGTGLKYDIGEALGVHGWNDTKDVLDFCSWYGVDPDRLITIPIPGGDGSKMHTRTVFQALQQQVDLFGKPTKTFYSDLAEYAIRKADKYALQFIGSPEGSSTFKKLSEKDTVSFADVLQRYDSARPGIERLCEIIGDIKPRHYSIASSQAVVGDRVDLLVVSVDWLTPNGEALFIEDVISHINFSFCRVFAIWAVHALSRWAQSGPKSHRFY